MIKVNDPSKIFAQKTNLGDTIVIASNDPAKRKDFFNNAYTGNLHAHPPSRRSKEEIKQDPTGIKDLRFLHRVPE